MGVALGTLAGRLVHPTAPVLLTKSGPLGTRIRGSPRGRDDMGRLRELFGRVDPFHPFRVRE